MKMLLTILPPFWPKMPPIGLGYLQGFLNKNDIDCDILDLNNIFYNLSSSELKRSWLVSCNKFLEENIFGIIQKNHREEYNKILDKMLGYEIIGFSCFKSNMLSSLNLMRTLKSRNKDLKIISGGPEIARQFYKTSGKFDNEMLNLSDLIVVGEGERPILNYLKKGIGHGKISLFCELDNLNKLPFPVYKGIDISNYPRKNSIPLLFSRGCKKRCGFCSERLLYKRFRSRPVKNIINEIKYHRTKNKTEYFVFHDSLINANLIKLEELCDSIMDNFGSIKWEAQVVIRNDMNKRLLDKIKKSGCYNLFIGLESGSDRTLRNMNKGFTTKNAVSFFKKLNDVGLFFGISIIVGYPGETESDFMEGLDFIIKNKSFIPKIEQINPFIYYYGATVQKKVHMKAFERFDTFVKQIKCHGFKYTNAFLGNLMEK